MFVVLCIVFLLSISIRSLVDYHLVKNRLSTFENKYPIWVIVLMFILWASWFAMAENDPSTALYPFYLKTIGLILSILAGILFFGTIFQLKGFSGKGNLIRNGLFKYFRHPMYLGFILILIGYPLIHSACYTFLFAFPGIIAVLFWRKCEEKVLRAEFTDYANYADTTWF